MTKLVILGGDKIPMCPYHQVPLLIWKWGERGEVLERRCGMDRCGWRWQLGKGRLWVMPRTPITPQNIIG